MANDLVTRLLLNSSEFDNNIRRSTQQVKQMQATSANLSKGINAIGGAFTKIAAPIGFAMGGLEAFNKVMNSSQTLSDGYNRTMEAGKGVVDEFFYSLGSGDFSVFSSGLSNIITLAKEAYDALDSLGNAQISFSYFDAGNQAQFQEALAIFKDPNVSKEAKEAAKKTMDEVLASQTEMVEVFSQKSNDAITAIMNKMAGVGVNATERDLNKIMALDITKGGEEAKAYYAKQYDEYLKTKTKIERDNTTTETVGFGMNVRNVSIKDNEKIAKEMESVTNQYKEAILYNTLLVKVQDEELTNLTGIVQQAKAAEKALAGMQKQANKTNTTVKPTGSTQTVAPIGSLKELDAQIQTIRIQYTEAVDPTSRAQLKKDLDALVEQKRVIEFQAKFSNQPEFKKQAQSLASLANTPDLTKIEIPKSTITSDTVSTTNDYVTSLNAVANAMTAVNTANVEGAAGWISWAGSLMTATGTAIMAIQQIIAAKTAEAAASGAAEAAKTPVVGWLMVGGAIASVLAAMSSIPKFGTGGIVGGNSTIGDMNLARVNAGEMILNNRQQRNLFNLLNGNESSTGGSGGRVEFKIKGNELVGVLNNYNSRLNKIR